MDIHFQVRRLEELKLQNLEKFILLTREEIEKYCDLMFYSEEDKQLFTPYYSANIGENLLSEHEKKLECLVQEYNNYENLYMLVNRITYRNSPHVFIFSLIYLHFDCQLVS